MWWADVVVSKGTMVEGRVNATNLRASWSLSMRMRFMPWMRQNRAVAWPMPEAAPVMRAVAPGRKTGWRVEDMVFCSGPVFFLFCLGDGGFGCCWCEDGRRERKRG